MLAAGIAFFLGSALFLFADLGRFPVVLWDESRLAVNALEMSLTGPSIVTTFGFVPDLWNTKPPLLIWLMSLSLQSIPNAEIALRVSSATAALLTLAITYAFTWRVSRSQVVALLAGTLLLCSRGFYSTHVARTGDYDALLVLFTTAYLATFYFLVHGARVRYAAVAVAALCVVGAVLTKGVGGLVPGAGFAVYVVLFKRWRRVLGDPAYWAALVLAVVPIATFYVVREAATPGYLQAMFHNEFQRYGSAIDMHPMSSALTDGWRFYPSLILKHRTFAVGLLFPLVVPVGWLLAKPTLRVPLNYSLVVALTLVIVISCSKTRYFWYAAPAYPWMAVAFALAVQAGVRALKDGRLRFPKRWSGLSVAAVIVGAVILVTGAVYDRYIRVNWYDAPQSYYGPLFKALIRDDIRVFTVVDPGRDDAGPIMNAHYNPIARFYRLLYETRYGASIDVIGDLPQERPPGRIVASCSPMIDLASIAARWIEWVEECAAVVDAGSNREQANPVQNERPSNVSSVRAPTVSR